MKRDCLRGRCGKGQAPSTAGRHQVSHLHCHHGQYLVPWPPAWTLCGPCSSQQQDQIQMMKEPDCIAPPPKTLQCLPSASPPRTPSALYTTLSRTGPLQSQHASRSGLCHPPTLSDSTWMVSAHVAALGRPCPAPRKELWPLPGVPRGPVPVCQCVHSKCWDIVATRAFALIARNTKARSH